MLSSSVKRLDRLLLCDGHIYTGHNPNYSDPGGYIDVVLDKVIWTVNWLHNLNYEAIPRSSSTCD